METDCDNLNEQFEFFIKHLLKPISTVSIKKIFLIKSRVNNENYIR